MFKGSLYIFITELVYVLRKVCLKNHWAKICNIK